MFHCKIPSVISQPVQQNRKVFFPVIHAFAGMTELLGLCRSGVIELPHLDNRPRIADNTGLSVLVFCRQHLLHL